MSSVQRAHFTGDCGSYLYYSAFPRCGAASATGSDLDAISRLQFPRELFGDKLTPSMKLVDIKFDYPPSRICFFYKNIIRLLSRNPLPRLLAPSRCHPHVFPRRAAPHESGSHPTGRSLRWPSLTQALMTTRLQNRTALVQQVHVAMPGNNEILVRVRTVAINPTDWKRACVVHQTTVPNLSLQLPLPFNRPQVHLQ